MTETTETFEIQPGVGVGPLVLGMTQAEVREVLGEPEKTETDNDSDDKTRTISWEYRDGDLEADFCSDDDDRLGTITIADPLATLMGAALIGLEEDEFLETASKAGIGPIELDEEFEEIDARDFVWEDKNISFWVSDGVLENMTVMPMYDESGEKPQWPSRG